MDVDVDVDGIGVWYNMCADIPIELTMLTRRTRLVGIGVVVVQHGLRWWARFDTDTWGSLFVDMQAALR